MAGYFARFGDLPMVMDFAFGYNKQYPSDLSRILNQYMDAWHAFVPFCPEHPEGWAYYRDYFLAGTRVALKNGLNAFLYELFNESSYNCQCPWNRRAFLDEARTRYGTIAAANATWGTDFDSFDEMAFAGDWAAYPGVWYDWCAFTARRYAAVLKQTGTGDGPPGGPAAQRLLHRTGERHPARASRHGLPAGGGCA